MEFDKLNGKLEHWALMLMEYDLKLVRTVGLVNMDIDSLNLNPSLSQVDFTELDGMWREKLCS